MQSLAENHGARMVRDRLAHGPATTIELQATLPLVHVAKQIWELRHRYDLRIMTTRLHNGIALYTWVA